MTIFEEEPVPRVFRDLRIQRIGSVLLPLRVLGSLQRRLRQDWEARRVGAGSPEPPEPGAEGPLEVDPPETYGEHGELVHPHRDDTGDGPHLDLEG